MNPLQRVAAAILATVEGARLAACNGRELNGASAKDQALRQGHARPAGLEATALRQAGHLPPQRKDGSAARRVNRKPDLRTFPHHRRFGALRA